MYNAAANAAGVNSTRAAGEAGKSSPVWVGNDQQWVLLRPSVIFTAQNITRTLKGSCEYCVYSEGTKNPKENHQGRNVSFTLMFKTLSLGCFFLPCINHDADEASRRFSFNQVLVWEVLLRVNWTVENNGRHLPSKMLLQFCHQH